MGDGVRLSDCICICVREGVAEVVADVVKEVVVVWALFDLGERDCCEVECRREGEEEGEESMLLCVYFSLLLLILFIELLLILLLLFLLLLFLSINFLSLSEYLPSLIFPLPLLLLSLFS